MTKLRLLALLAVVALLLFPAVASADTPPERPCRFYGTVTADGQAVPDGTVITAVVKGQEFETTTPVEEYGTSTYAIKITQPAGESFGNETVTFMIGDGPAKETGVWDLGENKELNLTSGEPTATPVAGAITSVEVTSLPAGSEPTVEWDADTGELTLGIPDGDKGDKGDTGAQGVQGDPGKDAPIAIPIVALVLAVIAIGVAAMAMRRKS
jgi:hypothetical protein